MQILKQHLRLFGLQTYPDGHVRVSMLVHIHVANPLAVTQHGDAFTLMLDLPHQLAGAPRDDQIYVTLQL